MSNQKRRNIFVTHYNPDLDACMGIWLFTHFIFPKEKYILRFVPMGGKLSFKEVRKKDNVIYIDTSGGKYDHHHTGDYVCATSLVMEDFTLGKDPAIKRMVEYALAVDHGKISSVNVNDFDLVNTIEGLNRLYFNNPEFVVNIIMSCLDGIYTNMKQLIEAEKELERAVVFDTKWGKGAGIVSSNPKIRHLAHRNGLKIFLHINPIHGYRGFSAPGGSNVDFNDLYERIKGAEPEADWFLHSSKELLLCGSAKARDRKLSSLSLEDMIEIVKTKSE